jgi:hypothetical protein
MVIFVIVNAREMLSADPAESGPARLEYFVRKRLGQMHISGHQLARRGGPDRTTLRKAVNGTGRLRECTLARIDSSLGWAPGSAETILAGGVPQTRVPVGPDDEHAVTVLRAAATLLDEATELIGSAKTLVRELTDDTGDGAAVEVEGNR